MTTDATEMMAGAGYFDCSRLHCRMRREICADRWRQVRQINLHRGDSWHATPYRHTMACRDCPDGERHAQVYHDHATTTQTEGIVMATKSAKIKTTARPWRKICANCGREMAIVREGLCGLCAKMAQGKSGAARSAALAEARHKVETKNFIKLQKETARDTEKLFLADPMRNISKVSEVVNDSQVPSSEKCIELLFAGGDMDLYLRLVTSAKKHRRTVHDEVLQMIEHVLDRCQPDPPPLPWEKGG